MSNHLAIATVTAALQRTLQDAVGQDVAGAVASAVRPNAQDSGLPQTGVNVFLYQGAVNPHWRNNDVPTRDANGNVLQRPRAALDLHYLFSFYGNDAELEPQTVMGSVVRTMHASPMLDQAAVTGAILDNAFLATSDLDQAVERVRFTPNPLTLDELSNLWSTLFETPYVLSTVYTASVVLLDAVAEPRRALPVRARGISVFPLTQTTLEDLFVATPGDAVVFGSIATLRGSGFQGSPLVDLRLGNASLSAPATYDDQRIELALTDPALRAGVQGAQIILERGRSNVLPTLLRPTISATVVPVGDDPTQPLEIVFQPAVGRGQRVVALLNEFQAAPGTVSRAYVLDAPADNGITSPADETTDTIRFDLTGVPAGTYLVQAEVDGGASVLTVGPIDGVDAYDGPTVVVP